MTSYSDKVNKRSIFCPIAPRLMNQVREVLQQNHGAVTSPLDALDNGYSHCLKSLTPKSFILHAVSRIMV